MGKSSMEAAQHANSKGSPSLPFAIVHFLGDEVPHSGNSAGTFCSGNRVMGVQHCPMSMLLTTNSNHIRLTSGRVDYPFQRILQNDQKKPWVAANMATQFIALGPYSKDIGKPTVLSFYLLKNNGLLILVYLLIKKQWLTCGLPMVYLFFNVLQSSCPSPCPTMTLRDFQHSRATACPPNPLLPPTRTTGTTGFGGQYRWLKKYETTKWSKRPKHHKMNAIKQLKNLRTPSFF